MTSDRKLVTNCDRCGKLIDKTNVVLQYNHSLRLITKKTKNNYTYIDKGNIDVYVFSCGCGCINKRFYLICKKVSIKNKGILGGISDYGCGFQGIVSAKEIVRGEWKLMCPECKCYYRSILKEDLRDNVIKLFPKFDVDIYLSYDKVATFFSKFRVNKDVACKTVSYPEGDVTFEVKLLKEHSYLVNLILKNLTETLILKGGYILHPIKVTSNGGMWLSILCRQPSGDDAFIYGCADERMLTISTSEFGGIYTDEYFRRYTSPEGKCYDELWLAYVVNEFSSDKKKKELSKWLKGVLEKDEKDGGKPLFVGVTSLLTHAEELIKNKDYRSAMNELNSALENLIKSVFLNSTVGKSKVSNIIELLIKWQISGLNLFQDAKKYILREDNLVKHISLEENRENCIKGLKVMKELKLFLDKNKIELSEEQKKILQELDMKKDKKEVSNVRP